MSLIAAVFIGLSLLGALSPLLTFAALFQQKEWRLDRLKEHLRREGFFSQLFGKIRPSLLLLYIISLYSPLELTLTMLTAWVTVFAALSAAQFLMHKQRMPQWTSKAMVIVALSCGLTLSLIFLLQPVAVPVLFFIQPIVVLIAWGIMKPLDSVLKKSVMAKAAALRATMQNITVISIAGSVGKTTTKELIGHLLQDVQPLVTPQHVNSEMGVAQWMMKSSKLEARSSKLLIIEMGAYRAGEIKLLCQIAQPTIGVMTALGSDHLALFGSEEAIVNANAELIEALPPSGHAFLDGTNPSTASLSSRAQCPVTVTNASMVHDVRDIPQGLSFQLDDVRHEVPLHGTHNIANILLAIAVAKHLGVAPARIRDLLKTFRPLAHTFNVRTEGTVTLLDDTYNLSPLSMKAGIAWAAAQAGTARVLLTSGLQEAGVAEAQLLEELGAEASKHFDRVVFTGKAGADAFAKGFGKQVEILGSTTPRIPEHSVLAALGRMPLSSIQRLLPSSAATNVRAVFG